MIIAFFTTVLGGLACKWSLLFTFVIINFYYIVIYVKNYNVDNNFIFFKVIFWNSTLYLLLIISFGLVKPITVSVWLISIFIYSIKFQIY